MNDRIPTYPPNQPAKVRVPTDWVNDGRLRFRELGVLVAVAEGGTVTVADLGRGGREGREAIHTALCRLETCGYVQRASARGGWRLTDWAARAWRVESVARVPS